MTTRPASTKAASAVDTALRGGPRRRTPPPAETGGPAAASADADVVAALRQQVRGLEEELHAQQEVHDVLEARCDALEKACDAYEAEGLALLARLDDCKIEVRVMRAQLEDLARLAAHVARATPSSSGGRTPLAFGIFSL